MKLRNPDRLSNKLNQEARALISHLKHQPEASDFLFPVDYIGLKIPWYPKIVKLPMDLSTIKAKLKKQKYSRIEDVYHDIELI